MYLSILLSIHVKSFKYIIFEGITKMRRLTEVKQKITSFNQK